MIQDLIILSNIRYKAVITLNIYYYRLSYIGAFKATAELLVTDYSERYPITARFD